MIVMLEILLILLLYGYYYDCTRGIHEEMDSLAIFYDGDAKFSMKVEVTVVE